MEARRTVGLTGTVHAPSSPSCKHMGRTFLPQNVSDGIRLDRFDRAELTADARALVTLAGLCSNTVVDGVSFDASPPIRVQLRPGHTGAFLLCLARPRVAICGLLRRLFATFRTQQP